MERRDTELILLEILNLIRLKNSELLSVLRVAKNAREKSKHTSLVIASMKRFKDNSHKAAAVMIRLQALGRMIEKNDLHPWFLTNDPSFSASVAHRALISAAARHPLSLVNGDFVFDRESFLSKALELAKHAGPLQ
jgi:hypothetical protein